jgi:hypothetical protein
MRIKEIITLLSLSTIILINSAKSQDNQQAICLTEKDCLSLSAPIIFSKGGLTKFLQTVFNKPEYAQDVLPHDMSHFIQCLDYAQNRYQKRMHGRHVLRIFTHKMRAVPYINDKAFLAMLDDVFPIMRRYYDGADQKVATSMKETINKILYDSFLTQFDQFKASPQTFFDALADDITVTLYDTQTVLADVSLDEFRRAFTRFLEIGLSKIVWHAEDGIKTWQSALNIADKLVKMTEANMFDSDELYELHDSLLERYCFFLDVVNYDMQATFFEELKSNIAGAASQLLDDDELELCLETRRQRFTRLLCECEFKLHAHDQGFMLG